MYYNYRSRPSFLKRCFNWLLATLAGLVTTSGVVFISLVFIAFIAIPARHLWNYCVVGTWPTVTTLTYFNTFGMLTLGWLLKFVVLYKYTPKD